MSRSLLASTPPWVPSKRTAVVKSGGLRIQDKVVLNPKLLNHFTAEGFRMKGSE